MFSAWSTSYMMIIQIKSIPPNLILYTFTHLNNQSFRFFLNDLFLTLLQLLLCSMPRFREPRRTALFIKSLYINTSSSHRNAMSYDSFFFLLWYYFIISQMKIWCNSALHNTSTASNSPTRFFCTSALGFPDTYCFTARIPVKGITCSSYTVTFFLRGNITYYFLIMSITDSIHQCLTFCLLHL